MRNRVFVSHLLFSVLTEKMSVLEAVSNFPKNYEDKSLDVAFHALIHLEADEDLRARDALYKEEQNDYIELIAQTLQKGESLPQNIIAEYDKLYPETAVYKKDTKENIIKRLLKKINL